MVLGYEKGQRQYSARHITRGEDPLPIDDLTLECLSITEAILCFTINTLLQHKAIYNFSEEKTRQGKMIFEEWTIFSDPPAIWHLAEKRNKTSLSSLGMSYFAVEQSLPALIGRWVILKRGEMLRDFRLRFYLADGCRIGVIWCWRVAGWPARKWKTSGILSGFNSSATSLVFRILEGQVLPSSDPE